MKQIQMFCLLKNVHPAFAKLNLQFMPNSAYMYFQEEKDMTLLFILIDYLVPTVVDETQSCYI